MNLGQRGALQLPMMIALTALALAGWGTWSVLRQWRHLTELQLRLDRCVGDAALELQGALTRIESGNLRILAVRTALAAAPVPAVQTALRASLVALARLQDLDRFRWNGRRALWLVQSGCQQAGDLPWPLPQMSWTRLPADLLGEQPLRWEPQASKTLRIQVLHRPRAAAAEVRAHGQIRTKWRATWTSPSFPSLTPFRPGSH